MAPAPEHDQQHEDAHGQDGQRPARRRPGRCALATSVSQPVRSSAICRSTAASARSVTRRAADDTSSTSTQPVNDGQRRPARTCRCVPTSGAAAAARRSDAGAALEPGRGPGAAAEGLPGPASGAGHEPRSAAPGPARPRAASRAAPSRSPSPHARPSVRSQSAATVGVASPAATRGVERAAGRPSSGGPRRRRRRRPRVVPQRSTTSRWTSGVTFSAGCRARSSASTTRSSAAMPGSVVNSRRDVDVAPDERLVGQGPADVERDEAGELEPVHGARGPRGRTGGRGTRAGRRT